METDNADTERRVHIVGASGSGTSTLGRLLANRLMCPVFDTDAFYWEPTDPPFERKRSIAERIALLGRQLQRSNSWVLSGSLAGWGDEFIPSFTDVVFLELSPSIRLERLRRREIERYGADRIGVGGGLHEAHESFMAWATAYDTAGLEMRSRAMHLAWLKQLPASIRVHQLDSAVPAEQLAAVVMQLIARGSQLPQRSAPP